MYVLYVCMSDWLLTNYLSIQYAFSRSWNSCYINHAKMWLIVGAFEGGLTNVYKVMPSDNNNIKISEAKARILYGPKYTGYIL